MISFKQFFTEAIKMRRIPHFHQMTVLELAELLTQPQFLVNEKVDGVNCSIGILDGKVYVKSKKGPFVTNVVEYMKKSEDLPVFYHFGRLLDMLQKNGFEKWNQQTTIRYSNFLKSKSDRIESITIFGELFGNSQMNSLFYDEDKIGKGAFVVFGVYINDGKDGIEISTLPEGIEIMQQFVKEFNKKDNWNVYYQNAVELDFDEESIEKIRSFIEENKDLIKSKKRDSITIIAKQKVLDQLQKMVMDFRGILLKQIKEKKSFLGNSTDIEGVIIRNINTGAITKLVDIDYFTKLNTKNWELREEIVVFRKKLFRGIIENILKSADIFLMKGKQEEKAISYLELAGKDSFDSLDELLEVFYRDANEEVQLKKSKLLINNLEELFSKYISEIENLKKELNDRQKNKDTKIDQQNYNITLKAFNDEISKINSVFDNIKKTLRTGNPYIEILKFIIGPKGIEELSKKFLKKNNE